MLEIIQGLFAIALAIIFSLIVWESSKMIEEKKERQRKGLTDYYDNLIKKNKCTGGEDE